MSKARQLYEFLAITNLGIANLGTSTGLNFDNSTIFRRDADPDHRGTQNMDNPHFTKANIDSNQNEHRLQLGLLANENAYIFAGPGFTVNSENDRFVSSSSNQSGKSEIRKSIIAHNLKKNVAPRRDCHSCNTQISHAQ